MILYLSNLISLLWGQSQVSMQMISSQNDKENGVSSPLSNEENVRLLIDYCNKRVVEYCNNEVDNERKCTTEKIQVVIHGFNSAIL